MTRLLFHPVVQDYLLYSKMLPGQPARCKNVSLRVPFCVFIFYSFLSKPDDDNRFTDADTQIKHTDNASNDYRGEIVILDVVTNEATRLPDKIGSRMTFGKDVTVHKAPSKNWYLGQLFSFAPLAHSLFLTT